MQTESQTQTQTQTPTIDDETPLQLQLCYYFNQLLDNKHNKKMQKLGIDKKIYELIKKVKTVDAGGEEGTDSLKKRKHSSEKETNSTVNYIDMEN
jgi:hypothetical protein